MIEFGYRKMNNKNISLFFLIALIGLTWGSCIYLQRYVVKNYDGISIRLEGTGVKQIELEAAIKQEQSKNNLQDIDSLQVTAWNRGPRITIYNTKLNTTTKTRIVTVYGDMAKVCPFPIKFGSFCYEKDTDGCVIDEKTAYDLFRDKNVVGNMITYESKQYVIRGIVKSKEQLVIINSKDEKTSFTNLEMNLKDNTGIAAINFINDYQLTSDYITVLEGSFYARLLYNTAIFPAVFIWLCLVAFFLKKAYKKRNSWLQCLVYAVICVLICYIFIKTTRLYFPDRWIPTRWSDFSFWNRILKEWRVKWMDYSFLIPLQKDTILRNTILLCNVMSVLTTLEIGVLIKHLKEG